MSGQGPGRCRKCKDKVYCHGSEDNLPADSWTYHKNLASSRARKSSFPINMTENCVLRRILIFLINSMRSGLEREFVDVIKEYKVDLVTNV